MDRSLKRSSRIHELELKHQNALHQTSLVSKDEDARRLKLKAHLLRDSKGTLQDQLSGKDDQISKMSAKYHQTVSELQAVKETVRKQNAQIKSQTRDFTHLQTELQSLESVSQDSAKLLTEKLALSRELSVLKPELEHVKSQLSHQQSVIAEKHALERQLNSLEVELETEKRSKQRAQKDDKDETDELQVRIQELERKLAAEKKNKERVRKDGERALAEAASQQEDNDESDKLQAETRELEKKLAAEKRDKVRVQKEGERALSEATAQHEVFEERLGTMKAKLRETREELKKCQAQLSNARAAPTVPDVTEKTVALPASRKQTKKRRAEEISADVTIDTPHADEEKVKRALKKRGLDPTLNGVGEKSTFSITPFLNRTKSSLDDSTEDADVEADQSYVPQRKNAEPSPVQDEEPPQPELDAEKETAPEPTAKPTKAKGRQRKALGEISTAKNANATKRSRAKAGEKTKASKPDASQEKPDEEPAANSENHPASPPAEKEPEKEPEKEEEVAAEKPKPAKRAPIRKLKPSAKQAETEAAEPEPKMKRRKLLGGPNRTLFDDEDGEVKKPAPAGKVSMAPARKLGAVGAGVKRDAFAGKTFSPLKRDRRGVHASFLA